jgi:hypothetical protein
LHSFSSLLDGRVRRRDLELVTLYLRPGWSEETTGSLKFLGNPNCPFAHVPNRRRQDCLHQTNTVQQRGPWSSKGKGSHDWVFRRSIAWLPDSLSTLRRVRYLTTTQDSLPVAGQALLNGLFTRKVPMKGFKVASLHSYPPFPSFLDANRVALGGCPPRAPADPDVLALEHPVPRPTASPSTWSPKLSDRLTLTCLKNLDVFNMFPSIESAGRRFAFLHWVLRGEFPSFNGTIKALRNPTAISPHFVSFAWRYLGCTRYVRSLADE